MISRYTVLLIDFHVLAQIYARIRDTVLAFG